MTGTPVGDALHDSSVLDELVPAVRGRRHLAVIAAAGIAGVALVLGAVTGWIVPLTEGPHPTQWGGTGPVNAVVHVANDSPRSIEITGMGGVPDGLSVVGYSTDPPEAWKGKFPTVQSDVFPVRLAPAESVDISVVYRVDDCAAASQADGLPTVDVRFPGWTGFWVHTQQVSLPDTTPWTSRMTQFACPA